VVEPSQLQNDIVKSLRLLQDVNQVHAEFSTESGYSLDIVIVYQGDHRIGVEVDGPSHFAGQSQCLNGKTILKHRQLQALEGMKLVSIPYWEWDEIDMGSKMERKEKKARYLKNLLEQGTH
jgi:RAP domain